MIGNTATTAPPHDDAPSVLASVRAWVVSGMTRFAQSRRNAAEREIARFIENGGDRLTDDSARRIVSGRI